MRNVYVLCLRAIVSRSDVWQCFLVVNESLNDLNSVSFRSGMDFISFLKNIRYLSGDLFIFTSIINVVCR